jgi:small conductance mechanosensitive channel
MAINGEALTYLNKFYDWIDTHLINIISTAVIFVIILVVYRILLREINRLREKEVIDLNTAFLLNRISKWTVYIIFGVLIFNTLGVKIDFFLGLWVLAGGTIIGFASMNTIGNALAGLIIMVSRPFKIDDGLYFQDQYVMVENIDLIYTRMRTLDNDVISVPNQIILNSVISNQSIYDKVRRSVAVTVDYNEPPERIRGILLSAIGKVDGIVLNPKPYVWITDFPNFAMEYSLFYYISESDKVQMIDAKVREVIVNEFAENNIDMSTPNLIKSLKL